jgi:hypothetical protein
MAPVAAIHSAQSGSHPALALRTITKRIGAGRGASAVPGLADFALREGGSPLLAGAEPASAAESVDKPTKSARQPRSIPAP